MRSEQVIHRLNHWLDDLGCSAFIFIIFILAGHAKMPQAACVIVAEEVPPDGPDLHASQTLEFTRLRLSKSVRHQSRSPSLRLYSQPIWSVLRW